MNILKRLFTAIKDSESIPKPIRATVVTASAVTFQGVFYMDRTERATKLGLTLIGGFLLNRYESFSKHGLAKSLVVAHILNFFLNGQPWVLLNHRLRPGTIHTTQATFENWMTRLESVGQQNDSIAAVAVYGPPAREDDHLDPNSDLDVRVIRYPGVVNGITSALVLTLERVRANLSLFPLDIYVFDTLESLEQLREDEDPKVLVDKEGWL